jgi:hypothetical protein
MGVGRRPRWNIELVWQPGAALILVAAVFALLEKNNRPVTHIKIMPVFNSGYAYD